MWKQLNLLFSKSVKNMKLLPAENFGNIKLYQQTAILKIIYNFRIEILLWTHRNFYFQKNCIHISMYFLLQ